MMRNHLVAIRLPCWLFVTVCYVTARSKPVASNPVIIQHPQSRYVIKNDTSVTLDCGVQGEPRPQITWYRDRMLVSADASGDSVLLRTGQLQLRNSYVSSNRGQRSSIIGDYYCNATNPLTGFSVVSRTARVEAAEKPAVTQGPKDVAVMENSDVLFHCSATGYPKPVIVWKKLDGQIPAERSEIRSDNSLKVKSVQSSDEGQYVCRVENALGSVQVNAKLTVFTQPSFVVVPTDKMALVGQRLKIRCVATGNPPPTVHWNKLAAQTLLFPNEYSERIHVANDGTLNIHAVQSKDAGEYSCQALSSAGSSFVNIRIGVTESELRPPPIIYQGAQNQTLPVGGTASLPCLASGEPAPAIYWFKGSSVVTTSQSRVTILNSGTLEITDLSQSDTGLYTCVAISETGETSWLSGLIVEQSSSSIVFHQTPESSTFPGAPSKPLVTNVTDTAIWLSWKPSDNHGASAVTSYSVEYFNQKTCQCWTMVSDGISQPHYVVNNLLPNTTYVFLVRAQNSHGVSLPSPVTAAIRTKAAVSLISSSVVSFSLDILNSVSIHLDPPLVLNSSSVRLKWKVSVTRGYRHFDGYHVMHRRVTRDAYSLDGDVDEDGNVMARQMEADYSVLTVRSSMETSFVLTNLQHSSSYEIFVQPFNGLSLGATSNMVRVLMPDEVDVVGLTSSLWTDQAWIVATLVSLVGGLFVVGLCVCTLCVVRQRHRFNKQALNRAGSKHSRNGDPQPVNRTRYDPRCLDPLLTIDGAIYSNGKQTPNGRRCHGNKSQMVRCCYDNSSAASNELKQTNSKVHLPEVSVMSNGVALPRVRTPSTNNTASRSTQSVSPVHLYGASIPNPEAYMIQRMSMENRLQDDYDMIGRNDNAYEQWQNYDWL